MPKISIPNNVKQNIRKIQKLNDGDISKLHNAILNAFQSDMPSSLTSKLIPIISKVDIPDSRIIAETIIELYKVRVGRDLTVAEFIDDICDAMEISGIEYDNMKRILLVLLDIGEIELSAKAEDLQTEDERTFCRARILTDLRPVFSTDVSKGPKAMVIVHKLKLGYHDEASNSHKDFHVSLDSDDLKTLRKIIDRAEQKANSLKTAISNFKYLAIS